MDIQPTQHLGFPETHPKSWRAGVTCGACTKHANRNRPQAVPGPNFNIARLRADNAGGYTQREIAKDIFDGARASGKDITRVR